jgi:hypothetical protein
MSLPRVAVRTPLLFGLCMLLIGCAPAVRNRASLDCTPSPIENADRAHELATCAFRKVSDYCAAAGQWREQVSRYGDLWEVHSIPAADCRVWRAVLRASDGALVTMETIPK